MAEEEVQEQATEQAQPARRGVSNRASIVLVVIALLAGVAAAKYFAPPQGEVDGARGAAPSGVTSVRSDAVADYEAAVATGKPIYVLFHSRS